jgi:hypothetical protein
MTYFEVQPLGHYMKPKETLDALAGSVNGSDILHIAAKTNKIVRFYFTTGGIQHFI